MTAQPTRVVFDCNIFVQTMLNPCGSAAACLQLVKDGAATLFVSAAVLAEVADVLNRPRFKQLLPDLTPERIAAFIEEIAELAVPIANVTEEFRYERDPEDEPYINLAIICSARYVVSHDHDLLDLMKPHHPVSQAFQRRYPMLRIVAPPQFLFELRSQQIQ